MRRLTMRTFCLVILLLAVVGLMDWKYFPKAGSSVNTAAAGQQGRTPVSSVTVQQTKPVKHETAGDQAGRAPASSSANGSGRQTPAPLLPILYDQTNDPGANATSSQNFEAAFDTFDDFTADDFAVPSGQTWNIGQVNASGLYFNGAGPALSVNVIFYADSATLPGATECTYSNLPMTDSAGNFQISLPSACVLGTGTHWVAVQVNMDFGTGGQWGWLDRNTQSNSGAAWENPGGGFGAGCSPGYGRKTTCVAGSAPDQIFQLLGTTGGSTVLYDQTATPSGIATNSQNFEAANDAFDDQLADDFLVPAGQTWNVQQVNTGGLYFNGPGPARSVNVVFYADSSTLPGAVQCTYNNIPMADSAGNFTIPLPTACVLGSGLHWVSVQANMDFTPNGEWGWNDRMPQSNSGAAWQNPGGGFGVGCTTYSRRTTCVPGDDGAPDQIFQLIGTTGGGGATIAPAGATLVNESCPPVNGGIDPGETVTLNLNLINNGSTATSNLVATLQPNANVLAPSGPMSYGAIAPGATVGRNFTFTANGNCGDTITLTLQLQDGSTDLGTVTYTKQLGATVVNTSLSENFDGVVAPALPAGWTTTATGVAGTPWTTSTVSPFSAPNDAFAPDNSNIGDEQLNSPTFTVGAGSQVTFKNNYNTEPTFDGMVLEISINGGAFADIIAAGGSFVTGGYNATISTAFGSPIAGRMAWAGNSGGYITSTVNLPASAAGQNVQLRWRMASDNSVAAVGVRIDDIVVSSTSISCNTACQGSPLITTTIVLSCSGANKVATITVKNGGTGIANNVVLTTAVLGGVNGTPLPQSIGTLAPGAQSVRTVTFSGAPSGLTTLQVAGTYTGGSFNTSKKVVAPTCAQ